MQTKMQFQKNANVIAADGQPVGHIDRVVLNPQNNVVTHLVVHKGGLFGQEDRIVPIELVLETNPDEIVLSDEAGNLEAFPPFEEEHIVDTEENVKHSSGSSAPLIYGSPVTGMPIQPAAGEKFVTRVDKNIPEGTVAMKEGAKVISADGKHIGNLERVFTDIPDEQITHLLISHGMLTKNTKLIPIDWVKDMDEDVVNLQVQKASVDQLPNTSILK